jgi:pimeloyl-ACP methyl ester carboxylesterase
METEEGQDPTMKDLAILASQTYTTAEPRYEELGYKKINDLSTKDIHTFHHEPKKHYVIAHRGTDLNSQNDKLSQVSADFKILQGNQKADKLHRDRAKDTERIIKHIREKDNHDIHLTAHSLGGSTIQNTLIKKPYVLDNVKSVHTFNAGTSPIFKVDLDNKSKKYKQIADKSTHHIIKGDAISENANKSMIGKVKRYTSKQKPTFTQRFMKRLDKLSFISPLAGLAHWAGTKIINTSQNHSIDNFIM